MRSGRSRQIDRENPTKNLTRRRKGAKDEERRAGRPEKIDQVDVLWELQICLGQAADELQWVVDNDVGAEVGYHKDAEALETAILEARELKGKHRAVFDGILSRLRVHVRQDEEDDEVKRARVRQIHQVDLPRLRAMCERLEGITRRTAK